MAATYKFINRDDIAPNAKDIDKDVKNKWNWAWCGQKLMAETKDEHLIGDCFRKIDRPGSWPGEAFCEWCMCIIKYGSSGKKALQQHAIKFSKHLEVFALKRTNYQLPGNYFKLTKCK